MVKPPSSLLEVAESLIARALWPGPRFGVVGFVRCRASGLGFM